MRSPGFGLSPADQVAMTNRIPVAFAVTYLIGVVGAAWFLAQLAPRIMGVDLEEECRRFERELQGGRERESTARRDIEYRAYMVQPGSSLAGRRVYDIEQGARDARVFVERIRRGSQILETDETTTVLSGDTLAITGRRELLVERVDQQTLGVREVDDRDLLDIPAEVLDVVVTRADIDGRTLTDLSAEEAFAASTCAG